MVYGSARFRGIGLGLGGSFGLQGFMGIELNVLVSGLVEMRLKGLA